MTTSPPVTPAGAQDVRERIVRTTLDLIGEYGLGGLTNRRIAHAAGISLGTLTYHFSSQDTLLRIALSSFVDNEIDRLSAITADLRRQRLSSDDAARLVQQVIEIAATRHEQIAQFELYLHAARDPGVGETVRRCYDAYDTLATAAMNALGTTNPARDARMVLALIEGFELRRLATGSTKPELAELVSAIVNTLRWQ